MVQQTPEMFHRMPVIPVRNGFNQTEDTAMRSVCMRVCCVGACVGRTHVCGPMRVRGRACVHMRACVRVNVWLYLCVGVRKHGHVSVFVRSPAV